MTDLEIKNYGSNYLSIDRSKVEVRRPNSLEMICEQTEGQEHTFVLLRAQTSGERRLYGIHSAEYVLFASTNPQEAQEKYQHFLKIIESGDYYFTIDMDKGSAELVHNLPEETPTSE